NLRRRLLFRRWSLLFMELRLNLWRRRSFWHRDIFGWRCRFVSRRGIERRLDAGSGNVGQIRWRRFLVESDGNSNAVHRKGTGKSRKHLPSWGGFVKKWTRHHFYGPVLPGAGTPLAASLFISTALL